MKGKGYFESPAGVYPAGYEKNKVYRGIPHVWNIFHVIGLILITNTVEMMGQRRFICVFSVWTHPLYPKSFWEKMEQRISFNLIPNSRPLLPRINILRCWKGEIWRQKYDHLLTCAHSAGLCIEHYVYTYSKKNVIGIQTPYTYNDCRLIYN